MIERDDILFFVGLLWAVNLGSWLYVRVWKK